MLVVWGVCHLRESLSVRLKLKVLDDGCGYEDAGTRRVQEEIDE
jgi:hypothetical protein